MKRALSILLVLALAVPIFWLGNPLSPGVKASADTYRKGYQLKAEKADRTGIFPDTGFLLTVPGAEIETLSGTGTPEEKAARLITELGLRLKIRTTASASSASSASASSASAASASEAVVASASASVAPAESAVATTESAIATTESAVAMTTTGASISTTTDAALTLTVTSVGSNTFRVQPAALLSARTLYFLDITATDGETVTFAFQTRRDWGVVGTLPADRSAGVPVDTGIEIYFTHPGVTNLDKHFSISPATDGRFETHGSTVAFVPRKPLKPGIVYTVTVKSGLPLPGTEEKLTADLVFSFETSPDPEKSANPNGGYLGIGSSWLEFPTADKPVVPFDISLPDSLQKDGKADLSVTVFRYADDKAFTKALEQKERVPYWAWWSYSQNLLSTSGLTQASNYVQALDFRKDFPRYTTLPAALPAGFYLVELKAGSSKSPLRAQALLQVTDTAAWFIEDKDTLLFWVNSVKTGQSLQDVTVESLLTGVSGKTSVHGDAKLDKTGAKTPDGSRNEFFRLRTADGNVSIYSSGFPAVSSSGAGSSRRYGYGNNGEGEFWRYSGLDRTLYKPSDTVRYWGFARSRTTGVSPQTVTVEVAQGGWMYPWMDAKIGFWMPMLQKPLISRTIPVQNGFWDGSIALPALDAGYYTLTVKTGDETIATSGFSVENYVKPAWQMTATADKKAIFSGEKATFTATAAFFDGTPVARQKIRYSIQDAVGSIDGEGVTDARGELRIPYEGRYQNGLQGESWTSFNATAELPETGEVYASANLSVFMNDIEVETSGTIVNVDGTKPVDTKKARTGRLTVQVNKTLLDNRNDEDASNDSLKGEAVSGQVLKAVVTVTTWERVEDGEEYDFVNKVVVPRYHYQEKKETAATGTLTTDKDGKATWEFPIPAGSEGYYNTQVTTADAKNREMSFSVWNSDGGYDYPQENVWYSLTADKTGYRDGETVKAAIERSDKKNLTGRTLFVASWKGIQSWRVASEPRWETIFKESMAPNLTLDGVLFDGTTYHAVQTSLSYDSEEKRITFDIQPDRTGYRPGDTVKLTLTAKDPKGKPVPATVNVALVDEALFKLSDQFIDVLPTLYGWMDNGIIRRAGSNGAPTPYGMRNGMEMMFSKSVAPMMMAPVTTAAMPAAEAADMAVTGGAGQAVVVRKDFRDSAYFAMTRLDASGKGELTFTLPDNITDWRVSISGISEALQGGNGKASAIVSLPFFLSETLNATYLTGDAPDIGLTAYGTGLKEGEDVTFTVTSPEQPTLNATVTTKAFTRVHLPLGQLKEGSYTFLVKAKAASGLTDAVERRVAVVGSYREMQKTQVDKLANGMRIPTGTKGLTRIAITDPARAALLQALQNLAWQGGHRLDQRLVSTSAQRWLNTLMGEGKTEGDAPSWYTPEEVDVSAYRRDDGGYGILPYAESDLRMSALLTGLLKENGDTEALRAWFYGKLYASDNPPPTALYGLAILGEPVLGELQTASLVKTATTEETLFTLLAFAAVGDLSTARTLWDAEIAPLLEKADPYIRLKAEGADKDENLQLTALASAAAAALRLPDADGLHRWVENNPSRNVFTGIENLLWTKARFDSLPASKLSFTWTYAGHANKETLENGNIAFITVPAQLTGELVISDVSGDGALSSTFTAPLEGVGSERKVSLQRAYYSQTTGKKATEFALNDIVRVELDWNISADAMDSVYEITDWLPAGLAPIDNPWQYGIRPANGFWYRSFEGQQADFVVGRDWHLDRKIVYYARVTSPGTYTAEGSVMRGSIVKSSVLGLPGETITIRTE